jgi:hypothetical protein
MVWKPELEITMTGAEEYPVKAADLVPRNLILKITKQFKDLPRYAGCLEKAQIVQRELGGILVLGVTRIFSARNFGCYWMEFNPPLEFHSWVTFNRDIIFDFALPGMIEKGSKTKDHLGPILEGRKPFILIGKPPNWVQYEAKQKIII